MINASLSSGTVPDSLKNGIIIPLLKKPSLDPSLFANYRPITNIPFLSKVFEKVVASALVKYLDENQLFDPYQSAYRKGHSTESALLKVYNDMLVARDKGHCVLSVYLDLSAAFDTIDHIILIRRLSEIGVSDTPLAWFLSYLSSRHQSVLVNSVLSEPLAVKCGVPQGSTLGPILFLIYMQPLGKIIQKYDIQYHMYADDTQMYSSFPPECRTEVVNRMELCIDEVQSWLAYNKLCFNASKTEVLYTAPARSVVPVLQQLRVGNTSTTPSTEVRNIGVTLDPSLSMEKHISNTCKVVRYHLHNIRKVRQFLNADATSKLVHALVTSRLDYCNGVLYGLPWKSLRKLQLQLNVAARLIALTPKREHITPTLHRLHWLPIHLRINFKILLFVYKSLHGSSPHYISNLITLRSAACTRTLRSTTSSSTILDSPVGRLKTCGDRSFYVAAPKLWNQLPKAVRESPSLAVFKSRLKSYLFSLF